MTPTNVCGVCGTALAGYRDLEARTVKGGKVSQRVPVEAYDKAYEGVENIEHTAERCHEAAARMPAGPPSSSPAPTGRRKGKP